MVYARLIAFGNGGLHALYDKTDGFYRRQLILTTKDKVDGREDDPYLIDKLRKERDGIFLWALEGLQRLVSNNYVFTESVDAKQNLVDAQEEGNNILAFMKSEGYLQFEIGKKIEKYGDSIELGTTQKVALIYEWTNASGDRQDYILNLEYSRVA